MPDVRVVQGGYRKRIAITLDGCDEATVLGDHELMEYAVYNLLTNAVKYSPAETHVTVSARLNGGQLRIAVADQGMGMDAKEVKQVFQKFYRTKGAEKSGVYLDVTDDHNERSEQWRIWVACNVVHRGAGVAYYLSNATYVDPTLYDFTVGV